MSLRRAVTLADIAARAGVSKAAVSAVLCSSSGTIRIAEDTAERVRKLAAEMGYRPHAAARAMANRRSNAVGVLLPNQPGDPLTHPLGFESLMGLADGLQAHGLSLSLARIAPGGGTVEQARMLRERSLDALVVLHQVPAALAESAASLTPVAVFADSHVWKPTGCLRRDERQAGLLAAQAAAGIAGGRIYVVGPATDDSFAVVERMAGIRSLLPGVEAVCEPDLDRPQPAWLVRGTICLCLSLYQAQVVRSWCERLGLRIGHDVAILCCDDSAQLGRLWPDLARAVFRRHELGLTAAELVISGLAGALPPSRLLPTSWRAGASGRLS